ncbi:hypothetical protein LYSHEL_27020 [Lysobacter helvus]|uniref:Uncharacterized protein n=2 Tax=Lysobacteraceae TaxID=32033 RepID=A0ABM7Q8A7_9GAMM|nr:MULTISPECIES: hypothetical protein [Lysobacter]BCT93675.1 hypothetical protein LYSCAS_26990 [Lysobacter caseinilyticus]BCT96831.1 hypothetical protein LYSHEL_27020 [Lysobacter helvus]
MPEAEQDLEKRLLAAALYELRVQLSGHLGEDDTPAGAAARFAYTFHNQALAVLSGERIDVHAALDALDQWEPIFGEKYLSHFRRTVLSGDGS